MATTINDIVWRPTAQYVERANVTRLMRTHGIASLAQLRRRSVQDIEWFWDAVVADLGIEFSRRYTSVLDRSHGIEWARWFADGQINVADACVGRWASDAPGRPAVIAESEDGEVRTLTFAELADAVDRVAAGLRRMGIRAGDAVGVFLPMVPEAVIAAYAIAKIGAVYVPIFSGFAAPAVAARLSDVGARVLVTADGTWRRGRQSPMKPVADEALVRAPGVEKLIVVDNLGLDVEMSRSRDVRWDDLTAVCDGCATHPTAAEDTFMVAYTSGTTGKPKGAVHVHGGLLVKVASEAAYQLDVHPGDVVGWMTDMGWIMGPWTMLGAHANGATLVLFEGAPDYPGPERVWSLVERHRLTMLGVSPTLIRSLRQHGDDPPARHDLSSLRTLGSTGEPWNPDPYLWLAGVACGSVPIINISGGTEVGACFLSPHPVEPIKVCSLGGPSLGMDMDVFDAAGQPLRGEVGELVCKQPWPGMTRGIWGDQDRYVASYWSMYPGVWRHGDWAMIDDDGQWFLFGRSDDAINVAGKRLGPAEVESVLVADPAVAEAAVIGVPHAVKGEAVWCFCVAAGGDPPAEGVEERLRDAVAEQLGRPFKPARLVFVPALPKTRSAKIIRRAVRAVALGDDPGDLSSAENPESLEGIRRALA
jgi:acetyl-CoA synthetase